MCPGPEPASNEEAPTADHEQHAMCHGFARKSPHKCLWRTIEAPQDMQEQFRAQSAIRHNEPMHVVPSECQLREIATVGI